MLKDHGDKVRINVFPDFLLSENTILLDKVLYLQYLRYCIYEYVNWLKVKSREIKFAENDKSYKKQKERQNIEISRIIERIVR